MTNCIGLSKCNVNNKNCQYISAIYTQLHYVINGKIIINVNISDFINETDEYLLCIYSSGSVIVDYSLTYLTTIQADIAVANDRIVNEETISLLGYSGTASGMQVGDTQGKVWIEIDL